jgi:hypothetical protein
MYVYDTSKGSFRLHGFGLVLAPILCACINMDDFMNLSPNSMINHRGLLQLAELSVHTGQQSLWVSAAYVWALVWAQAGVVWTHLNIRVAWSQWPLHDIRMAGWGCFHEISQLGSMGACLAGDFLYLNVISMHRHACRSSCKVPNTVVQL